MAQRRTTDEFLHHQNVAKLKERFVAATDAAQRQMALKLLTEEVINGERKGWPSDL